jgi:hypothetical protein
MSCRCEQNAVIAHLSYSLSCQKLQSGSSSSSSSSKSSPRTVLYNSTVCHAHRTQMRYQTPSNAAKRPSRVPTFHSSLPFHASPFLSFIQPAQHKCLKPLRRRRRGRGAPGHAPGVAAALVQPLAGAHVEVAVEFGRGLLAMDKVAEAAAHAALARVEATTRLAEVGHWRQFAVDGAAGVPARVERVARFLRILLVLEAHVDVADEVC